MSACFLVLRTPRWPARNAPNRLTPRVPTPLPANARGPILGLIHLKVTGLNGNEKKVRCRNSKGRISLLQSTWPCSRLVGQLIFCPLLPPGQSAHPASVWDCPSGFVTEDAAGSGMRKAHFTVVINLSKYSASRTSDSQICCGLPLQ